MGRNCSDALNALVSLMLRAVSLPPKLSFSGYSSCPLCPCPSQPSVCLPQPWGSRAHSPRSCRLLRARLRFSRWLFRSRLCTRRGIRLGEHRIGSKRYLSSQHRANYHHHQPLGPIIQYSLAPISTPLSTLKLCSATSILAFGPEPSQIRSPSPKLPSDPTRPRKEKKIHLVCICFHTDRLRCALPHADTQANAHKRSKWLWHVSCIVNDQKE